MRVHKRAAVFLISFVAILIIFTVYSSLNVKESFKALSNKNSDGIMLVHMNDIVKQAQLFLEAGYKQGLTDALKQSSFTVRIYSSDGITLYNSEDSTKVTERVEINQLLSALSNREQLQLVSYNKDFDKKQYALLIIKSNDYSRELSTQRTMIIYKILTMSVICLIFITLSSYLIFKYVLSPFKALEGFAVEVARGNLELPLEMKKVNIFGSFTWAFDMLRTQLITSREREQQSKNAKKELVAVLSHDIRTPVAAIRAYAEGLQSMSDRNNERGVRYTNKIIEKSDEITKLTNDLFLHAISDLEKLEINPKPEMSRELLISIIEPLVLQHSNRILITGQIPDVEIITDRQRLTQVIENLIINSAKYACGSEIHFTALVDKDGLLCRIEDFGDGVMPEDLPFLFEKFFRGSNAKENGQQGSGLGLYISKFIIEKLGGNIKAFNRTGGPSGFIVEFLIICSEKFKN